MNIRKHSTGELEDELTRRNKEPLWEETKDFVLFYKGQPVMIKQGTAKVYVNKIKIKLDSFNKDQEVDAVVVGGVLYQADYPYYVSKGYNLEWTVDRPIV